MKIEVNKEIIKDYKINQLVSIDLLKGIAICMVILVHSIQRISNLSSAFDVFKFGQMGCQIFFVVSGYSIAQSWSKYRNKQKGIKLFYVKRFLSIAPGYYLTIFIIHTLNIILSISIGESIGHSTNSEPISILCNLFFLHGFLPFCNNNVVPGGWYIGTTAIFYIFFPIIFIVMYSIGKNRKYLPIFINIVTIIIIIAVSYLFGYENYLLSNNVFVYLSCLVQLPCFALGIQLWIEKQGQYSENKNYKIELIISIIIFIYSIYLFFKSTWKYKFMIIPTLVGYATYFALKYLLVLEKNMNYRGNKIITKIGNKSYFIYLVHSFFVWTMPIGIEMILNNFKIVYNPNILYIILLPLMFVFSYVMSIALEKICTPITKKIIKRLNYLLGYK